MYEYMVGTHFINKISSLSPVFVSTYGIYKKTQPIRGTSTLSTLVRLGEDFSTACTESKNLSLLIQHIKGRPLYSYLFHRNFVERDAANMFYMVYQALSTFSTIFTHYDLHAGNIMILKLSAPIEYVYEGVTFRSIYIPKIIDYGRSFFDNKGISKGGLNSNDIYQEICSKCTECGKSVGFKYFKPPEIHWHMDCSIKNESHDLQLLSRIYGGKVLPEGPLKRVIADVVYGKGLPDGQDPTYGTIENLGHEKDRILNVHDAKDRLEKIITPNIDLYPNIMGRLTIYKDKPMIFERL
jgi:hypothetical protein